jgi:hypothetical protein
LARHNQLSVPSQEGVRRDDGCHVAQRFSTEPVRPSGEPAPVIVCQPNASTTDPPPEKAILLDEVRNCRPLPAIEPAGDREQQQVQNRNVDHERQLISRTRENGRNSDRS